MEETDRLPLKRVELSLSKFNEVAIPHHLDLLRQHRANIIKYSETGSYSRVRAEQTNARRVCAQLRSLLQDMEALRARVLPADRPAFDAATRPAADLTLRAITEYLETSPLADNRWRGEGGGEGAGSALSTDSVGVLPLPDQDQLIPLQVDDQELSVQERTEVLRGWSALQDEVRALHAAWRHVHAAAEGQRAQVEGTSTRVEVTAENVEAARQHLSVAERLRGNSLAIGGACVGLLAGGPAGLALGAKAGAAAALAGSLLGYLGGRAVRALPAPWAAGAEPGAAGAQPADKCGKKE